MTTSTSSANAEALPANRGGFLATLTAAGALSLVTRPALANGLDQSFFMAGANPFLVVLACLAFIAVVIIAAVLMFWR